MSVTISAENCEYRGEGNTGLVVRLRKEEKVLRLLKQDNAFKVTQDLDEVLKQLQSQIEVVQNVMEPLFGADLVHRPTIVSLSKEDVRMLNNLVSAHRPGYRSHKSVKEEDCLAFMLPDYCSLPPNLKYLSSNGPEITVEIKPKQGFIVEDEFFPQFLTSKGFLICRYCLMQQYKMKKGVISGKSGYCPSDLFSGCPVRMLHALKMLNKTPQNNFRLFKNQRLVFSEEQKGELEDILSDFFNFSEKINYTDLLCNLVIKALLKPFSQEITKGLTSIRNKAVKSCINAHLRCSQNGCHELPKGCVLDRLLRIQMLHTLSMRDLYLLYLSIAKSKDEYSDNIGCLPRSKIPIYLGESQKMPNETNEQYASRKIWEFLVALTAKDCSIMLVLKCCDKSCNNNRNENVITDDYGNSYLFSIAIADLDAKSPNKVEKIYNETPFILESSVGQLL